MHEFNRYVYAMANPIMFSDPSGLSTFSEISIQNVGNKLSAAALRQLGELPASTFVSGFVGGAAGWFIGKLIGMAATQSFSSRNLHILAANIAAQTLSAGLTGWLIEFMNRAGDIIGYSSMGHKAFERAIVGAVAGGIGSAVSATIDYVFTPIYVSNEELERIRRNGPGDEMKMAIMMEFLRDTGAGTLVTTLANVATIFLDGLFKIAEERWGVSGAAFSAMFYNGLLSTAMHFADEARNLPEYDPSYRAGA